jgi:hypothetical protein
MTAGYSLFSQLLKFIPRVEFERQVRQTRSERHARGVSSWQHLVSMLFCQLGRAHSLREIEQGLRSCEGKLNHLSIEVVGKSSLSYANAHRPWQLFEQVFLNLFHHCQRQLLPRRRFRFKNPLLSLDSSTIDLCLSMYDWALYKRTKGAVKLHLVLDHEGYLPRFAVITTGKVSDLAVARTLQFEPGTILVEDRGYTDCRLFNEWTQQGVYFVTRLREDLHYEVEQQRPVPEGTAVCQDQTIRLSSPQAQRTCPQPLRRIEIWDAQQQRRLVFLTNHFTLAARTIAAIYRDRWQIELFFKALKQNLKIKTFVGTSENAVRIQIWTALITLLIVRFLQLKSRWGWSLSNLVALLRMNLFTHRDLWTWLDQPFSARASPYPQQVQLTF